MSNMLLNRAQRRFLDKISPKRKVSIIPKYDSSVRVVVRVDLSLSFEDELMVLAALQELKLQNNQLKLEYATTKDEIFKLLKNRWFLRSSHQITDTEDLENVFEAIVGDDFSFVVSSLDREELLKAEEGIYSANHQKTVAELEQRQRAALEQGMKDFKVPIPDYLFVPRWHKTNGYLWKLADSLGLPVQVPEAPLKPFFDASRERTKEIYSQLAKAHISDTPFFVYDFSDHPQTMEMVKVISHIMEKEGYRAISLREIARAVGDNRSKQIAAMTHWNCAYVFGFVGPFLYDAWAANVPNVLAFYNGSDPRWDAVHPQNVNLLDANAYPEEAFPQVVAPHTILLVRKSKGEDKL